MVEGFDYKEYLEYVKKLGKTEKEFQLFLKKFLLEQAQRVVRIAKQRTPVDTGALINSWSIGTQKITLMDDPSGRMGNRSKNKHFQVIDPENSDIDSIAVVNNYLYVTISNGRDYAYWVEHGHHSYEGKYMLTVAVSEVEKAMTGRFDKQFKEFLKGMGVV